MSIISNNPSTLMWGLSKISLAVGTVIGNPFRDLADYLFPKLRCYLNNQYPIQNQNYWVGRVTLPEVAESLREEVGRLMECANISDQVEIFANTTGDYEGFGSRFGSAIVVPWEQIRNRNFSLTLENEELLDNEQLIEKKDHLTDNEVRFQMARAINRLTHFSFISIAARVLIAAFAIFLACSPAGWLSGLLLFISATLLYFAVNRYIEEGADIKAVKVLAKRYEGDNGLEQATISAINALRKMQKQNLAMRDRVRGGHLTVNGNGDPRFLIDPYHPSISSRIEELEMFLKLIKHSEYPLSL